MKRKDLQCSNGGICISFRSRGPGTSRIGIAVDVKKRLYEIQTDNPNKLKLLGVAKFSSEKAVRKFEKRMHVMFATQRIRGEWFASNDQLALVAMSAC